ncbi:MAG TPA: Crp/Fnr family transcriptional regulator [Candidatus Acidoferrales bacterium]|nr:Crp/Fnr family transcriptional regulator [Candidatus Acidoferrales bacterium]
MKGPYSPKVNGGFNTPKHNEARSFCQLTPAASRDLAPIEFTVIYPKGAILFLEGQQARGVFILRQGEVKLSISSSEGKRLIIRVAQAGDVVGLMATLAGNPYEVTAETICHCDVVFVRREEFLRWIRTYPKASQIVAKQISAQYEATCEQLRTVGLSASVHQKLARLLLSWSNRAQENGDRGSVKLSLTHEEMAECIGTTRETVTRALSEFRHRHLIALRRSRLMIPSRAALETFAGASKL